jgi:hypothetical protein
MKYEHHDRMKINRLCIVRAAAEIQLARERTAEGGADAVGAD